MSTKALQHSCSTLHVHMFIKHTRAAKLAVNNKENRPFFPARLRLSLSLSPSLVSQPQRQYPSHKAPAEVAAHIQASADSVLVCLIPAVGGWVGGFCSIMLFSPAAVAERWKERSLGPPAGHPRSSRWGPRMPAPAHRARRQR